MTFKHKNKFNLLAIFAIILTVNFGIINNILAQSDSEKTPEQSEEPAEQDRGLPGTVIPENLPNSDSIPTLQIDSSQSSYENPFAPNVIQGTPRRTSPNDILKTLENDNKFQTLISILQLADLDSDLENQEFLVLFAPTEEAFDRLTPGLYDRLILPENRSQLLEFIKNHFVSGEIQTADLQNGEFKMISGRLVRVKINSDKQEVQRNEITVKQGEFIGTQNGLIVPINRVLFAPNLDIESSTSENR